MTRYNSSNATSAIERDTTQRSSKAQTNKERLHLYGCQRPSELPASAQTAYSSSAILAKNEEIGYNSLVIFCGCALISLTPEPIVRRAPVHPKAVGFGFLLVPEKLFLGN